MIVVVSGFQLPSLIEGAMSALRRERQRLEGMYECQNCDTIVVVRAAGGGRGSGSGRSRSFWPLCAQCRVVNEIDSHMDELTHDLHENDTFPRRLRPFHSLVRKWLQARHVMDYHIWPPVLVPEQPPDGAGTTTTTQGEGNEDADVCCICLDPISRHAAVRVTSVCRHVLHRDCLPRLQPGTVKGMQCPLCRTPIGRHDLQWDTHVGAIAHAVRVVHRVLGNGSPPPRDWPEHVVVYHVCAREICNALVDHIMLQECFATHAAYTDDSGLRHKTPPGLIDARVARHVTRLQRTNAGLEGLLVSLDAVAESDVEEQRGARPGYHGGGGHEEEEGEGEGDFDWID